MYAGGFDITPGSTVELLAQIGVPFGYTYPDGIGHYRVTIKNTGATGFTLGPSGTTYPAGMVLNGGDEITVEAAHELLYLNADSGASVNADLIYLLTVL